MSTIPATTSLTSHSRRYPRNARTPGGTGAMAPSPATPDDCGQPVTACDSWTSLASTTLLRKCSRSRFSTRIGTKACTRGRRRTRTPRWRGSGSPAGRGRTRHAGARRGARGRSRGAGSRASRPPRRRPTWRSRSPRTSSSPSPSGTGRNRSVASEGRVGHHPCGMRGVTGSGADARPPGRTTRRGRWSPSAPRRSRAGCRCAAATRRRPAPKRW